LVAILSQATHYAHQRGVVHRDLKPANVLLASGVAAPGANATGLAAPRADATEFAAPGANATGLTTPGADGTGLTTPGANATGLADATGLAGLTPRITDFGLAYQPELEGQGQRLPTRTGTILGTPCYMAPEQTGLKGRQIGPAVDIYSLGAILYE